MYASLSIALGQCLLVIAIVSIIGMIWVDYQESQKLAKKKKFFKQ